MEVRSLIGYFEFIPDISTEPVRGSPQYFIYFFFFFFSSNFICCFYFANLKLRGVHAE